MHHGAASAWPWEGRARHRVLDGVGRYSGGIIVGEATVCRRCCIAPGRAGKGAISTWVQIALANSSNATANRRLAGSSAASS